MNKTALKKLILFVCTFVLLIVWILQICISGRTKVTTLVIKKDVDCITIEKKSASIRLEKINGEWIVSDSANQNLTYATEKYPVDTIVDSVSSLKLLGTISSGNVNRIQRYGLDNDSKISVKSYGKGKILRSLMVGKNSSSGTQSYVQVDGKKSVMIADAALHTIFDKTLPSLRQKNLYKISSDSISSVGVKKGDVEYELLLSQVEISGDPEPINSSQINVSQMVEWTVVKNPEGMEDVVLDQGAVGTWIASLATLDVSQWCEDDVTKPEQAPDIEVNIAVGGMMYLIDMFLTPEGDKYLCASNQTQGLFYVSKNSAENLAKNLDDLIVKFEVPVIEEQP